MAGQLRGSINFDSPVPIYVQLAGILRDNIRQGVIRPESRMPTQKDLVETFEVSRGTAARAVSILTDEGWLVVSRGKGVYVRPSSEFPGD